MALEHGFRSVFGPRDLSQRFSIPTRSRINRVIEIDKNKNVFFEYTYY